ncbi:MAG: multidrug transporter [Frankiales bacterium]|nr:multidrug transporter [Frankiales bacterium]
MSVSTAAGPLPAAPAEGHVPARRGLSLLVLSLAQLMVVLDATVVNIALPTAQKALTFSDADRQWIVTGYALAFGSLLLLGGRLSDFFGRKRMFVVGVIGFALASALGGAAGGFGLLLVARVLQGVFGAVLAPAALSLLTVTFTAPAERARAFAVFGGISGAGGGVGLLLGGVLTEYASWRWCLYVNLFIAAAALVGAAVALVEGEKPAKPHLDLPGVFTAVLGLVGLVYGLGEAQSSGWTSGRTLVPLLLGVVLLVVFVVVERRVASPLLPLRVVVDRSRGGAYLTVGIAGIGMFGLFLFLTYYLAASLRFSPVQTGAAFLPMLAMIMVTAIGLATALVPRVGPRPLVPTGALLAAVGMVLLTRLDLDSSYVRDVLPALLVIGAGLGLVFAPAQNAATSGVDHADAGVASAMINIGQQVGGSIGTALLSTFAASSVTHSLAGRTPSPRLLAEATIASYHTVFWWSAGFMVLCAVLSGVLFRSGPLDVDPDAAPVLAH